MTLVEKKFDEKKLKKVIKEGGKRGVEIEGAADMGGLQFFCTKVDEPEGDIDLLLESMKAMNVQADPEDEERKGCSGHIGKMVRLFLYNRDATQLDRSSRAVTLAWPWLLTFPRKRLSSSLPRSGCNTLSTSMVEALSLVTKSWLPEVLSLN